MVGTETFTVNLNAYFNTADSNHAIFCGLPAASIYPTAYK